MNSPKNKLLVLGLSLLVQAALVGLSPRSFARAQSTCTEVIGFSQSRGWFGGTFLSTPGINSSAWEGLFLDFAGIEMWTDPNYVGWTSPLADACASNSTNPDRVVLTITSVPDPTTIPPTSTIWPKQTPSDWVPDIRTAISNIRTKYPNVRLIILQPVIGGPNHQTCFINGTPVRASVNHPIIDQAIAMVVGGDVVAGDSPEVPDCSDYADTLGHLTDAGYTAEATLIATFYASFNPVQPPAPPVLSNISASNVTQTSATITWTTSTAASSQVEYGQTTTYGFQSALDGSLVINHSVALAGLTAGTLYHYRVKSADAGGNLSTSGDFTFTTSSSPPPPPGPPVISAVSTVNITATSATVTWTTDRPADSQVEFGLTTSYGSQSALDVNLVTSHSISISGLTSGTLYHFRVKSKDSIGNLASSSDSSFTTLMPPDTIPPSVSITSPSPGRTVAGSITVTATATDNVGVVGVQFRLDSNSLGAEVTSAPYSLAWDTKTTSDGSHILTAVARDAAGNQTTSAGVTITVQNNITSVNAQPGSVVSTVADANTQFRVEAEDLGSTVASCSNCRFQGAADLLPGQTLEVRLHLNSSPPLADVVILKFGSMDGTVVNTANNQFTLQLDSTKVWPPSLLVLTTPSVTLFQNAGAGLQAGQSVSVRGLLFRSGPQGGPTMVAKEIRVNP